MRALKRAVGCGLALVLGAAATLPPAARKDGTVDTYFGQKVADPYRWMEESGPELDSWARAQDAYTRNVLASIPGRDALRRHISDIAGKMVVVSAVTPVGRRVFFRRKDAGDEQPRLVMRDLDSGAERVLLNPDRMSADGHPVAIDQFQPSQDGRYVAVGISPAGSEEDVLRILDTATGTMLPETIDRARFASPSWLPDGRSFFYNRLRVFGSHEKPADRFTYQKVYLHRLGTDPDRDVPVFGAAVGNLTTIGPADFVAVAAITGTRYALGIQTNGVAPELGLYIARLPAGDATAMEWKPVTRFADGVVDVAASRDALFFRSHDGAPRYKVISVRLDKPDIGSARLVLPQGDAVITNIAAAADGLYAATRSGAASSVVFAGDDGKITPVALPQTGSIAPPTEGAGALSADPRVPGAFAGIDTWVSPTVFYALAGDAKHAVTDLGLAPPSVAPRDYLITETTVPAKVGRTHLPLSIIEKRGTPHDRRQPVLVEGYGAYGISEEPFADFVPFVRGWVDAGGVLAVAHVRGGGELGEDWHQAGRKVTKQNTIHDFIDCAWAMTHLGYASAATLAGTGTSAGGITIGGAITQMPSLFRAALIRVGSTDSLREEFTEGGPANVPEFGTVAVQADFNALLAMDAYQHVRPGVAYPAVLLTAGAEDHRVPLWESAKMAARLQADGGRAKGPALLRVDFAAGHGGIGAGRSQQDAELADDFAFLLWQLGVSGFQPAAAPRTQ